MPATTGLSAVPVGRAGVELQAAAVPGYFLSSTVQEHAQGAAIGQLAMMFEPGERIGAPGLSVGGRYTGNRGGDGYLEPMLRYRMALDAEERFSAAAIGFGTHARAEREGASYSATRGGLELALNARVTPRSHWGELHAAVSAAATGLDANGKYCLDSNQRFAVDCTSSNVTGIRAEAGGVYPSATAMLSLDFARHLSGPLHGGSLGLLGSVGSMPRVESGIQAEPASYTAAGLSLTLGLGAAE
ncbi:MAG TPA: hypothetical protein VJV79_28735 [Polyangiaceae bacterium]|nr:hypothetical protein [Polyangiaceae bacterium]